MVSDFLANFLSAVTAYTTDVFFVLAVVAVFLVVGFVRGKGTLLAFLFGLYPATLAVSQFPWYNEFIHAGVSKDHVHALVFFVALGLSYFIGRRCVDEVYARGGFLRVVDVSVLALAVAGLLLSSLSHTVSLSVYFGKTPLLITLFGSPLMVWLWLCAPLVAVFLCVRR